MGLAQMAQIMGRTHARSRDKPARRSPDSAEGKSAEVVATAQIDPLATYRN